MRDCKPNEEAVNFETVKRLLWGILNQPVNLTKIQQLSKDREAKDRTTIRKR